MVGWSLTFEQLPASFVTFVQATLGESWIIILAMNFIMLAIGMFIDLPAAVLLLSFSFVPALTLRVPERAVHPVGLQRQVAGHAALISQHSKRRALGNPEPGARQ